MQLSMQQLVFRTKQVRERELEAAKNLGVSPSQLMQRAAQSCLAALEREHPAPARVMILCGPGNNGGDGWVLARLASRVGYKVTVVAGEAKTELAQQAAQAWRDQQGQVEPLEELDRTHLAEQDVIVDALLGTGLTRDLDPLYARVVETLNDAKGFHKLWVMSIDCPTGLQSDTGMPCPIAVEADYTVTFIAWKPGLLTGQGGHFAGRLELAELGIAAAFRQLERPFATLIEQEEVARHLPPRQRSSHKGRHGHVLIIGGSLGMTGAAVLAGQAALRSGAGKVSILTQPESQAIIASAQPEFMVKQTQAETREQVMALLNGCDVVVMGPGLGTSAWAERLCKWVLASDLPVVLDADGLNLLSQHNAWLPRSASLWLAPHPGEAARLLECETRDVEQDRYAAVEELSHRFQAFVVLKGAGSLMAHADAQRLRICQRGSPALAVGGAGDVLSGIVGSLVGQGLPAEAVLPVATWLHAVAGEHAAIAGERGTLPSDLFGPLRKLVNP